MSPLHDRAISLPRHSPQTHCHCPSGYAPATLPAQTNRPNIQHTIADQTEINANRKALAHRLVNHCQHSYQFTVRETIQHEVMGSDMIPTTRNQADAQTRRADTQGRASALHSIASHQPHSAASILSAYKFPSGIF